MRKNLTIFCVLALSLVLAGNVFAQNPNAFFKMDTNLATGGFQETPPSVVGIGSMEQFGFAIYGLQMENIKGVTVQFEWDSGKASFRTNTSGVNLIDDPIAINGETVTPPAENCIIGASPLKAGETNEPGIYRASFAMAGGDAASGDGLLFFAVFRTTDNFKTDDQLSVAVTVTIADEGGTERSLGTRYFHVNQVNVRSTTWGEVKSLYNEF